MSDFSGRTPTRLEHVVSNAEFWPPLDAGELQEWGRIPAEQRGDTINAALMLAMISVNRELEPERCQWVRSGWSTLADVPAESLGAADPPEHELVLLYKQAVYAQTKAGLLIRYASINRRERAEHAGQDGQEAADVFVRQAQDAIRLLRRTRNTIEMVLL